MPMTGGRNPIDILEALAGPAWLLIRDLPGSPTVPADPAAVVSPVADSSGEYAPVSPWRYTGLAADDFAFSAGREVAGLEYSGKGELFKKVTSVSYQVQAQLAGIAQLNLALIANSQSTSTVAAAAGKPAYKRVGLGLYDNLKRYQIALVADRPTGAGVVTEPAPSNRTRPPSVIIIGNNVGLGDDESEFTFSDSEPVNAQVTFDFAPLSGAANGREHGDVYEETPGVIA